MSSQKNSSNDIFGEPIKQKRAQPEQKLQAQVCAYLKLMYPSVIFTSDITSGMFLPKHIAVKYASLRSSRALPDLLILHRVKAPEDASHDFFSGLALELKAESNSPFLKDGITLSSSKHVQEQSAILSILTIHGFSAQFVCGFDHARKVIDNYMNLK